MEQIKSIVNIVVHKVIGLLIFLIFLWLMSLIASYIPLQIFSNIVVFLKDNLYWIIIITIISIFAEGFGTLTFPFNLPAPLLSAIESVLIISILFKIWLGLDASINTGINVPINLVYILIFLVVLLFGYLKIISKHSKEPVQEEIKPEIQPKQVRPKQQEKTHWHEIGEEFKGALYELGRTLKKAFKHKEEISHKPKSKISKNKNKQPVSNKALKI
ncbi:MAG: hypothetical protein WC438_05070 [Candidatus Pacearchaeota archaeon]